MLQDRVVLCMKWGTVFPPVYVNVLFNACRKFISGEFRFVCLTDDPAGLDPRIETHPIPEIGCRPLHWRSGAWPKLSVFLRNLYDISGRALFIDLDTVVASDLDPFFREEGNFIAVGAGKHWGKGAANTNPTANTSVFAFTLGSQAQIVDAYSADPDAAFEKYRIEQVFAERHATSWRPWPHEWIVSYKRHLRRPILLDRVLPPRKPDSTVKVVAFHGHPRPIDLINPGAYNYERFPHYARGPVDWVRDYWLEHGWDGQPLT
jgi:hypothetical protein